MPRISELDNASSGPLIGTELVPVVQAGSTVKTTAQDIANLAPAGSGVTSVNGDTGPAVVIDAIDVGATIDPSLLSGVSNLSGAEILTVEQGGNPVQATAQQIADLADAAASADAYNLAIAFKAYGDSITNEVGASSPANAYINLLATSRGWSLTTNNAVDGDMVPDQADPVFAEVIGDGEQSTIMLGTNDQRFYEESVPKRTAFKVGHAALLAWLAIPDARKQKGQDADSETGTWTDTSSAYGGTLGRQSVVAGSTITFTVYGTVAYFCSILQNSIVATFTVSIDGVVRGSFATGPGATITSVNGRTFTPQLIRIPGLSEGSHSLVVTVVTASGGNPVYALWATGNQGHKTKEGPNVWVGNVPRFTSAGYTASGGSDVDVAAFNAMIRANVTQLAADGLNVALVDSASRLNPAVDLGGDGVHPDDSGHAVIANAFIEAINQIQKPRTQGTDRPLTVPIIPIADNGATYALLSSSENCMHRFTGTGTKTLNVDVDQSFQPGSIYHVTNRGASGDLTIDIDSGVTLNLPKDGTSVLEPGDTVSLHFVSATEIDMYGSTL